MQKMYILSNYTFTIIDALGNTNRRQIQLTLLKTTIVATLWNNLSCKVKVMAQFLYILYITVNVVTCAEQKSMYSHVSTLTFDQHQFHKFFVL